MARGQIITTLIESSSSQFSTYEINPNSLDMEIILPSSGFSDSNEDGSKFLLIDSDSILIYDSSMTDEYGNGTIVYGVWEEFIGYTVTFYGGYTDHCDNHFVDSVRVKVNNN